VSSHKSLELLVVYFFSFFLFSFKNPLSGNNRQPTDVFDSDWRKLCVLHNLPLRLSSSSNSCVIMPMATAYGIEQKAVSAGAMHGRPESQSSDYWISSTNLAERHNKLVSDYQLGVDANSLNFRGRLLLGHSAHNAESRQLHCSSDIQLRCTSRLSQWILTHPARVLNRIAP
jgi:hypothetical protein